MQRLEISQAIVVEGRYDKIKLEAVTDALIVECGGFGIFKSKELLDYIRRLAVERGIIILTDPDAAGFKIRSYIGGSITEGKVYHAYLPSVKGKEKRKSAPGKEGLLGAEGIDCEIIRDSLLNALPKGESERDVRDFIPLTKARLYELGYFGRENSECRRHELLKRLGLPLRLSSNALLKYLNTAKINIE
ncbi:MAG: DUF4093 domain-containing protein [Clostridia bacterium]|nr:DUF4093 domain-containing protein [Clostridia bacterium]